MGMFRCGTLDKPSASLLLPGSKHNWGIWVASCLPKGKSRETIINKNKTKMQLMHVGPTVELLLGDGTGSRLVGLWVTVFLLLGPKTFIGS